MCYFFTVMRREEVPLFTEDQVLGVILYSSGEGNSHFRNQLNALFAQFSRDSSFFLFSEVA